MQRPQGESVSDVYEEQHGGRRVAGEEMREIVGSRENPEFFPVWDGKLKELRRELT